MEEGTVYLRTTTKEGQSTYTEHRCWNVKLFVDHAHQASMKEGGRAVLITREEYEKAVPRKRAA